MKLLRLLVAAVTAVWLATVAAPAQRRRGPARHQRARVRADRPLQARRPASRPANALQRRRRAGRVPPAGVRRRDLQPVRPVQRLRHQRLRDPRPALPRRGDEQATTPTATAVGGRPTTAAAAPTRTPIATARARPAIRRSPASASTTSASTSTTTRRRWDVLGDFGVTFRRYEFLNPTDSTQGDSFGPPLLSTNTQGGRAMNPAAIVPGAEHPEETS